MRLLLLLSLALCALSLRRIRLRAPDQSEQEELDKSKCCCDDKYYDPPQCRVMAESQLTSDDRNPLKLLKSKFVGTKFCPIIDIFPGDGIGERKTHKGRLEMPGCKEPFDREPLAELRLERAARSGIEVNLEIPDSMQFLILQGAENLGVEDSYFTSSSKFQSSLQSKRAAQLMSKWRVYLTKKVIGTVTSRPLYDLWLDELGSDDFQPSQSHPLRLDLTNVTEVSRIDVDGRAGVKLLLTGEKQLLLVPYEPPSDGRVVDLKADLEDLKKAEWSLLAAPGVADGKICCCAEKEDNCTLQPPPCSASSYSATRPEGCVASDKKQEAAAEELATQLAKAKRLARDDADVSDKNSGRRVLYQSFSNTPMSCHSVSAMRDAAKESAWQSGDVGAELRTFKAIKGGSGVGGIQGLVRDVWGRHQHIRVGSGDSCIDLVYEGADSSQLAKSGCGPYQAKAAMVAVVRECFDAVATVETAIVRTWRVMAQAYIAQSSVKDYLENAGYDAPDSWQKLLKADVERIEEIRIASITAQLQADMAGVWHILQRASLYAQKYFDDVESYMANVNRKLDDVDKLFWDLLQKPGDGTVYPHKFNDRSPRDIVEDKTYQELMGDETTLAEKILPAIQKDGGEMTPQAVDKAIHECFTSLECVEQPLLFKLMQHLEDASFWKKVPTGWLAGLAHAPEMHPTPPTSNQFIFPRSAKEAFGKCFTEPAAGVEDARTLWGQLEDQVDGKSWLSKHKNKIFQGIALKRRHVMDGIRVVLDEAADIDPDQLETRAVQGAMACYPTLFGSLGMEQEIRDETGYKAGKRTEDMEQVLSQCSLAPQCARLAIEKLLHFNTKRWDMYAGVKATFRSFDKICNEPNPDVHANCQLFAACFNHQLKEICEDFPGCCGGKTADEVCKAANGTSVTRDIKTVMGY